MVICVASVFYDWWSIFRLYFPLSLVSNIYFILRVNVNLYEYNNILNEYKCIYMFYIFRIVFHIQKLIIFFLNLIISSFLTIKISLFTLSLSLLSSLSSLITLFNNPSTIPERRQLIDDVICRTKRKHVYVWTTCVGIVCIWRDGYAELRAKFPSCFGIDNFLIYFYLNIFL